MSPDLDVTTDNRKLVKRHAALLIAIALSAVALFLCIVAGKTFKNELEAQFRRETRNIAQILISYFDSTVRSLDETLLQVGSEYPYIGADSSNKTHQLHELLARHASPNSSAIALLRIIDKSGMAIAISGNYPFSPLDESQFDIFTFHASDPAHSALHISAPELGRISRQPVVRFSRPLRNIDGTFDGVVVISYKISDFVRLIEKLDVKNMGIVSLTGLDLISIIRSTGGSISYGMEMPANMPVRKTILSGAKEGTFSEISMVDDTRRIGYFIVSEVAPIYAYVAYDHSYLEFQYNKIFVLLGISWILFSSILVGSIVYIQNIERVRQQALSHAAEAVSDERKRILADMHDSIGASLAVLISHLNAVAPNWVELKQKATQILTELRLLVDSIGTERADLNDVLASVRHRMQSGIELAGIATVWKVNHPAAVLELSAHDALALRLILMETLSNVLYHANAKTVTFSVEHDEATHFISILITDDGCGYDAETTLKGVGLDSMRNRAKNMSVPTTVRINSAPGRGTTVRIEMQVCQPKSGHPT
jgi:signal transduction histidine kinase